MKKLFILLILSCIYVLGFTQTSIIAIKDATVIDVVNGKLSYNQTIIIEGTKITSISDNAKIPKGAKLVDAKGKYVIPGLWDMHAHSFSDRRFEWLLPLLIANGVTGVRELGTAVPFDSIHIIIKQVKEGKFVGPRFGAITQKIFNGSEMPGWPVIGVTNSNDARGLVKLYKKNGMDYIKVYNTLPREILLAIMEEAKLQGMPVGGHVPYLMSASDASDLGFASIEHNTGILVACANDEKNLRAEWDSIPANLGPGAGRRQQVEYKSLQSFDENKATELFKRFARNGTSLCPTVVVPIRNIKTTDELAKDDRLKYIPKEMRDRWYDQMQATATVRPASNDNRLKILTEKRISIVGLMQRSGVNILAGTDFPNPYIYPGFSLHDELELLVQGGLTPLQALQTATINAAKFLHMEKEIGTVAKGKYADLVILDANPLEQISNTRKIQAVIANGRLFVRADLDKLLDDVVALNK